MEKGQEDMTKPVLFKPNGKVVGIRGLYRTPTGRYFVRYAYHGIDKQMSVEPKNQTFSGLEKAAKSALIQLKKNVKEVFCVDQESNNVVQIDIIEKGKIELRNKVSEIWGARGCTQGYIERLLLKTKDLAICSSKKRTDIEKIDRYNIEQLKKNIEKSVSDCVKDQALRMTKTIFLQFIQMGIHNGINPVFKINTVKYHKTARTNDLEYDAISLIHRHIRENTIDKSVPYVDKELELFFILCVETGQRPVDIYYFDARNIVNNHYLFVSHKTSRPQRVKHLLSDRVMNLIQEIIKLRNGVNSYTHTNYNKHSNNEIYECFWSRCISFMQKELCHAFKFGENESITPYHSRHFFVSEIFKLTNSEFWASAFTHDGENTNQRHYLHIDQKEADNILMQYVQKVEAVLEP